MRAKRAPGTLLGHAIHEDITFTRAVTEAVHNEPPALASWLQLTATGPGGPPPERMTPLDDPRREHLRPSPTRQGLRAGTHLPAAPGVVVPRRGSDAR